MGVSLLASNATSTVTAYDINPKAVESFHAESKKYNKSISDTPPTSIKEAILNHRTNVILLCLVNETQCEDICFNTETGLINIVKPNTCIIVSSTVTASWCKSAYLRFLQKNIHLIDVPMSGGPIRAKTGELTMMASSIPNTTNKIMPLLQAMGKENEIHLIEGGVGMGSTAKMVHQLLAGVHIVAAAEALSLASKAGLDVEQMYNIVNGAAGSSWMFQDRGSRMVEDTDVCKSALDIFVKDLDIVHKEAKALKSPIPLASGALQQFISGQCLGLGKEDDSKVIQVYQVINGTSVNKKSSEDCDDK